jgi:hypothetical protein
MFYTRPLNPPILGDFQIRTPLSTLPDRAINWGAGGPSAILLRLTEPYWMEVTFSEDMTLLLYMEPSGGGLGDAAVLQRGAWGKTPPILRTRQAYNPPKSLGDNPHPKRPIVVSSIRTCQRVLHCPHSGLRCTHKSEEL